MPKTLTIATKRRSDKRPSVAEYLSAQIDLCGKTQLEIARDCGYDKPNNITMLKQGTSKLPISRIGMLSKSLGVDPLFLYSLVMNEYDPKTWEVLQDVILKQPVISANEYEIVKLMREAKVINPKVRTEEDRIIILDAINKLKPENASAGD